MPFVRSDGTVVSQRSWLRPSIVTDIVWGIIDTVGLFFTSLIYPTAPIRARRGGGGSGGGSSGSSSSSSSSSSLRGGSQTQRFPRGANIRTLPTPCASAGGG
jgi:hypothetical protein